jgi:hypothetical protein
VRRDVADARDAIMRARTKTRTMFNKFRDNWHRPDQLTLLAISRAAMPKEAWDLLDQQTKDRLSEVLDGKQK